ncbi:MAG: phosphoribosylamine--glycine ligase [Zetaproteobacteria bacterium]|nr:phosphoribosylamine--glycine ligase [Pseudobdellovibrionaceae bacterium]
MRVLLVGSGGREHALAWKLSRSEVVDDLLFWPGGVSMSHCGEKLPLASDSSWSELVKESISRKVDYIVVGPEQPLAEGLADLCKEAGLPVFGPESAAAELESSKVFAKEVMAAANIPTAAWVKVEDRESCRREALKMLNEKGGVVLKASGLAGGKGVFVCFRSEDVENGLKRLYETSMKGAAASVVVEEVLQGRECSFFTFLGKGKPGTLGFAVDFKRLGDGDQGPNTGGMGCYSPVPWLPQGAADLVNTRIVFPLIAELKRRNIEYIGCLYVGIMWSEEGPKVVEFNVRLGDPEAQVLALQDRRDWGKLIADRLGLTQSNGEDFSEVQQLDQGRSVAIVMASAGYPYGEGETVAPKLSPEIFKNDDPRLCIFGASVKEHSAESWQAGTGRVLSVVCHREDLEGARMAAYEQVESIAQKWDGVRYRKDIGLKATQEDLEN